MSLFPAYTDSLNSPLMSPNFIDVPKLSPNEDKASWLHNSSFPADFSKPNPITERGDAGKQPSQFTSRSNECNRLLRKRRHRKKEIKKSKRGDKNKERIKEELISRTEGECYVDRSRDVNYLLVPTLSKSAVPLYCKRKCFLGGWSQSAVSKKKKKMRVDRYFDKSVMEMIAAGSDSSVPSSGCMTVGSIEEELSQRTAEFNRSLAQDPKSVETWMKYVQFQDVVEQFEEAYKGGGRSGGRATGERKLAILERSLSLNPHNDVLLQERFAIAENIIPADKLNEEVRKLLERDPGNLMLWRQLISLTQGSLSRCSTTAVVAVYGRAVERLHQLRRRALQPDIELSIIDLMHSCGLYLRQAGLWEQLWTLLHLYLKLNLAPPNSDRFNLVPTVTDDPQLSEVEESIVASGLPLSALWVRMERLRESTRWRPATDPCDDPQQVVFAEDLAPLVQPLLCPPSAARLAAAVLSLLKLPPLPSSHCAHLLLGLTRPAALDSVESLLAAYFPVGVVPGGCSYLEGASELCSGPQYVRNQHGREAYQHALSELAMACGQSLVEPHGTTLLVWRLRYHRLLACLRPTPATDHKPLRADAKSLLKLPSYRNNLLLYREYALLERDLGNFEATIRVLETAISSQDATLARLKGGSHLASLYRSFTETLLRDDPTVNRERVTRLLMRLVGFEVGGDFRAAAEKFSHISIEAELAAKQGTYLSEAVTLADVLLPHHVVEWLGCHAWFLVMTQSVWPAAALLQTAIDNWPPSQASTIGACIQEQLYEVLVSLLHFHCHLSAGSFSVLLDKLQTALKLFPTSVYFLHTVASVETQCGSAGSPWWKLSTYFTSSEFALPRLFLIFVARARLAAQEAATSLAYSSDSLALTRSIGANSGSSSQNRIRSLLAQLTQDSHTRRCPLLWRLHLQFVAHITADTQAIKNTFYRGIEQCPWLKALYSDAIQVLPADLPQIQDLLIEKELRLHIMPEELEILRSDPREDS